MVHHMFSTLALAAVLMSRPALAWEDICSPFEDIYADGTELCEVMWGGAFEVVPDDQPGYTMWFFDTDHNPNDDVTTLLLGKDAPAECGLQYAHKSAPSPESDDLRECHPWKEAACCDASTVADVQTIRELYVYFETSNVFWKFQFECILILTRF